MRVSVTSAGACAIAGRPMSTVAHKTANRIEAFRMAAIPPRVIEPPQYYLSGAHPVERRARLPDHIAELHTAKRWRKIAPVNRLRTRRDPMAKFDLIVRGGRVIDPAQTIDGIRDV